MFSERKTRMIRIRCKKSTFKRFRAFVVDFDFRNYEDALVALMDLAKRYPSMIEQIKKGGFYESH